MLKILDEWSAGDSSEKFAPIVLFAYNRPAHLAKTLEALSANTLAKRSNLHIFIDGPKNANDQSLVATVRQIATSQNGFKSLTVHNRPKNYGLVNNLEDGLKFIFKTSTSVIVMEDDTLTSKFFLTYMNHALEFYSGSEKIWHISSWSPEIMKTNLGHCYICKYMNCWGFATWKHKWEKKINKPEYFLKKWTSAQKREFDYYSWGRFSNQLEYNKHRLINTWAIFWYATIFDNNGHCLAPSVSLTQNIGFDGTGENCGNIQKYNINPHLKYQILDFPVNLYETEDTKNKLKLFFKQSRYEKFKALVVSIRLLFLNQIDNCKILIRYNSSN